MNVMQVTMERTVQRSVQTNVLIHVIEQLVNVVHVLMEHGVRSVKTNVKKVVTIQAVILKHVTQRQVNVHVKWVITIQHVTNNVEKDVT